MKAVKDFLHYTGIATSNHAVSDLIAYKRDNPQSHDIEQALRAYSIEPPVKKRATSASRILGIFRTNYARLDLRVNTHFEPAIENCKFPIFLEIYEGLTEEQKDMVQWGTYYPERATATYKIPFSDFTKSEKYAIAWVQPHHKDYSNKSKVRHPAILPFAFFEKVEARAKAAGRTCPFPNYRAEWKKITKFAKDEYKVRLVANHTRKVFEKLAGRARLNPAAAAFLMGDKTKLNQTGHLPLIYNPDLRELDEIIQLCERSNLFQYLDLKNKGEPITDNEITILKARVRELEASLAAKVA